MHTREEVSTALWKKTVQMPSMSVLTRDMEAHTCVVGAGIAGLTTAYLLAKEGIKVVVLDDGEIGQRAAKRALKILTTDCGAARVVNGEIILTRGFESKALEQVLTGAS